MGQPPVPEKTAEEANPVVSAETEEEKGFLDSLTDIPLNSRFRGRWLAVSALHHGQYESFRATAEGYGDEALAGFDSIYDSADVQLASVMINIAGAGRGSVKRAKTGPAGKGRLRGTGFGTQTPVLAGAGGMPYGQGLQILHAEQKAAGNSVKNAGTGNKKTVTGSGGKARGKRKSEPGPCDHLRKGAGKGKYRGGAHEETKEPKRDGLDSHHMPAKAASPLTPNQGPAIQMKPTDHGKTSSNGKVRGFANYIVRIKMLLTQGKWREAMALEIKDVRRVAKLQGDLRRYNIALQEMLKYYHCLEKHNLLR
ncbi:hypothetical protein [Citrobacter rodentium]|uniref:Uncharacterized protein n=2 Tax=Citrobacter rodentium TaxID=67825 RepID=D2TIK7_CITRI|nr:hypothetical protein [Citrobacter rodentium]QBY29287.1 hypothetical protein E2R62_10740 [Citrobacter rodentium]CBG89568.1 hypothetical protein ROD_28271 [Citrobacter rodentium ICC168]HAT8015891.1 hypothetical protein [Citrobacter rodentium NBRC 105723 = DSM 16636]HAT8030616.1 hypothetical protein [Citrobacter rodentium]HAT8035433.1 hypothetical protein [Citrobacter rodentium]